MNEVIDKVMNGRDDSPRPPTLIVITGGPGSGKSTLIDALALDRLFLSEIYLLKE